MQVYFPNFKTKQGAIGIFDYLAASKDSTESNVIFNSDLNLEELTHLPGGTGPIDNYDNVNDSNTRSFIGYVIENLSNKNAQLFQDLYVLWKLKNKNKGIFVEVGTAFPTGNNNTWTLESEAQWQGVLIEPNPVFHKSIMAARSMPLETRAIHYQSDSSLVLEIVNDFHASGGLKENYEIKVGQVIENSQEVVVDTISFTRCLEKYSIPKDFDYLSYDTTGNQADIQNIREIFAHNYFPKIITIGHNYKSHRPALHNMLQSHGYTREFDYLSKWDDWYYHNTLKDNT